jgi:hypothetical protein
VVELDTPRRGRRLRAALALSLDDPALVVALMLILDVDS